MKRTLITPALFLTTVVLTLTVSFASASQVVYRWKDAQGNQVNSDRPPPQGVDYEVISTSSSMVRPIDAEESAAPSTVKPTEDNKSLAVGANNGSSNKNPEHCKSAKYNLEQLDTRARIRVQDDQGEYHFLSEEEKAAERQTALDAIKLFCE